MTETLRGDIADIGLLDVPDDDGLDWISVSRYYMPTIRKLMLTNTKAAYLFMLFAENMRLSDNSIQVSVHQLRLDTGFARNSIKIALKLLEGLNLIVKQKEGKTNSIIYVVNACVFK